MLEILIYFLKLKILTMKSKIPLKLYPEGVIEYSGNFFVDNEGLFILKIVDNKLSLPEYFKGLDKNHFFFEKTIKMFSILKDKEGIKYKYSDRKSAHKFIYDKNTNKSLFILDKKNITKIRENGKEPTSSIRVWFKDGKEVKGLGTNTKGGISSLRYYLSENKVYFKACSKWSIKI